MSSNLRALRYEQPSGTQPKAKPHILPIAGASFVSDQLVRSPDSNLRFFRLDSRLASRLFCFLLPERNYTSFAVREFMEFSAQRLSQLSNIHLAVARQQPPDAPGALPKAGT